MNDADNILERLAGVVILTLLMVLLILSLATSMSCTPPKEMKLAKEIEVHSGYAVIIRIDTSYDGTRCRVMWKDELYGVIYSDPLIPLQHDFKVGQRTMSLVRR